MKIHFAYCNQYKNGIDIAFADNTLLFLSCSEAEKNPHTTPNSQRLIDNLAIDNPLMYATLALDCELQAWADAMDEDWSSQYVQSLVVNKSYFIIHTYVFSNQMQAQFLPKYRQHYSLFHHLQLHLHYMKWYVYFYPYGNK